MQNSLEHAKHKFDAANTTRYRKALSILYETRDPSLFLYDDYTEKCFFAMQLILKCLLCKFFTAFSLKENLNLKLGEGKPGIYLKIFKLISQQLNIFP
mgnify:CR=1 FL=1